jgi:DNA-binding NtrC family response regulator
MTISTASATSPGVSSHDPSVDSAELTSRRRILVAEDNKDTRHSLKKLLECSMPVTVDTVADGSEALEALAARPYSILITDLRMPKVSGMQLIEEVRTKRLRVTVIVTTGHGSIDEAVRALQLGAHDFLTKPPDPERMISIVQRALRERTLLDEVAALRQQLGHSFHNVLSKNAKMHEIFELVGHVAETSTTVLIEGETGTGKEQVAKALHDASPERRDGPMVAINCAAVPETLLESELFGHEKGSFTGAVNQRKGRFEQAHGGTLFLDEVGDIPAAMQIKLLRVLQERRFERVGGTQSIEVDVRVVAATNRPLERLVKDGKFREDLFYRLNVVRIALPPLRERTEDIPLLATHFTHLFTRSGQPPCQVDPAAMEKLLAYDWPGNVRQLENVIERGCVTTTDGWIRVENLASEILNPTERKHPRAVDISRPLNDQLAELTAAFEQRYLRKAMRKTRGHVGRTARIAGLSRRSVTSKIAQYKIDRSAFTSE